VRLIVEELAKLEPDTPTTTDESDEAAVDIDETE
jgi:hypothetical protein